MVLELVPALELALEWESGPEPVLEQVSGPELVLVLVPGLVLVLEFEMKWDPGLVLIPLWSL